MAKLRKFYCLIVAFGLLAAASGCNKTKIKGLSKERGAAQNPTFTLRTVKSATAQTTGDGEFYISGASEMTIACSNCGRLNLAFARTGSGSGFSYLAKFSYPFVDRTYVCKANIKVSYTREQTSRDFVYGIYFCPEDPSTHSRSCNKAAAIEKCGF
jgi:hypothetical protein